MRTDKEQAKVIEIVPPPDLIQFPLSPNQVEAIVGLPKSTFLRWEREGHITYVEQNLNGNRFEREITETNLVEVLLYMKELTHKQSRRGEQAIELPKHLWLQTFDPTKPCTLVTPTGYTLRFQGDDPNPHEEQ